MELGFASAILPDLSLQQIVEFASSSGFSCVELMCWPKGKAERRYAGVTHVDVVDLTRDQAKQINELVNANSINISGLGYYPNPLTPDSSEAEVYVNHIRQVILAANLLGVKVVNSFIGRDWTRSVEENWPRFKEIWQPLIKFAEDPDICIAIE
ncbi:TPA: sugar phosphate isomerase/epimerase, partial [Candidatus Poribacteria bacterium]|nr:sugar phosphate isomerase/epimerase [Candidatus Poribacteria bacterium]